jgi:putative ABC transport system permease protein
MIPLKYNVGNLTARRVSTLMTVIGIGVVIAVMLSMMALYNGVEKATVSSGSPDVLMVLRDGAEAELTSWVSKDKFNTLKALPGVAKDSKGQPLLSPELVIVFKLPKKDDPKGSNVTIRGVTPAAFELRPQVQMVEGRMFHPGSNEIIVARRIRNRFTNAAIGDSFKFGAQTWNVVGLFDAKGTAFDSEMWADLDYLGAARKRNDSYSSVLVKPVDHAAFESIRTAVKSDNRLKLQAKSEYQYYADQTKGLGGIKFLVWIVSFFMTIGAVLGTMNSMYALVASRGRELATLRALGFKRRDVILTIIIESAFIALLGAIAGILLSLPVNLISTGTTNFNTFSEVAFSFDVDLGVIKYGLILTLVAGIIGGLIPAIGAARRPITTALRQI